MGALARTYFCHRGHIVADFLHHEVSLEPEKEGQGPCPVCGSTRIAEVCEWQDPDYWHGDVPDVPLKPIGFSKGICPTCGKPGHRHPRYDVSSLFERKGKLKS